MINPLTEEDVSFIQTSTGKKYVEKLSEKNAHNSAILQEELEGHDPRL